MTRSLRRSHRLIFIALAALLPAVLALALAGRPAAPTAPVPTPPAVGP